MIPHASALWFQSSFGLACWESPTLLCMSGSESGLLPWLEVNWRRNPAPVFCLLISLGHLSATQGNPLSGGIWQVSNRDKPIRTGEYSFVIKHADSEMSNNLL